VHLVKKILLATCIYWLCLACQDKKDRETTWIGGEIVNPKGNYVLLSRNNEIIDSIKLDENNFFLYEVKGAKEGLYSFTHNEYQTFYLSPGDSLMLRVNTLDFDESLSYSGDGSEENNLLIEFFLMTEEENWVMQELNMLKPEVFERSLDSLSVLRKNLYNNLVAQEDTDATFRDIAKAYIKYDKLLRKELYASANAASENKIKPSDPYFNYRKKIDYGNEQLGTFYPYYRFLNAHFDNLAYQAYNGSSYVNRETYEHNKQKMLLIDSLVTSENLKNSLLRRSVRQYLINGSDADKEQEMVNLFLELSTSPEHKEEIQKLAKATINLVPGNTIPNLLLVTADNTVKDLHSLIEKPTVIFFWSIESIRQYKDIHTRAAELRSKYPEYDFIGINTDTHFKKWRKVLTNTGYNPDKEYQFESIQDAEKKLVLTSLTKAFILDKDGQILHSNANLTNPEIEKFLLGNLNK
jgi:hypothetical protein